MSDYGCIRRGRWFAVLLGLFALASLASAQLFGPASGVPLRGPPLNTRPGAQQITVTDPVTGNSITFGAIPQHATLMPNKPTINPLNNYSIYDFPPATNYPGPVPVFAYPPEMQGPISGGAAGGFGGGIGGGLGGGIGGIGGGLGGGIGGIGGGIGGLGGGIAGGIGGIGGGIGGIGGGIGGIGGGIGGFGGGLGGGALGAFGARTFSGGQGAGINGFGGSFAGFGGAIGATGGY